MENISIQYTFWELINNYKIVIPIIQRDYAQGRENQEGGKIDFEELRDSFLTKIYNMIENKDASIDLDFIYGSIKLSKNGKEKILTPLDGQQRLTTLFLLHWYLARNEDGQLQEKDKKILKKFTYETRTSSKEFCTELIDNNIILTANNSAKEKIINSSWFFLSWQKDPTIKSMLNMIEDIHKKFFAKNHNFFTNLISDTNKPITFQFLELNNFGLTDSLYIKMNARGKPLTEFENFKAKFEQYLESSGQKKYSDIFSKKIDGNWTEFFWKHKKDNKIDGSIMRYFTFITEMLYYQNFSKSLNYIKDIPDLSFQQIQQIYSQDNSSNTEFLFSSFDKLYEIDDMPLFFEEIFENNTFQNDKIVLFSKNTNLFYKCINTEEFGIFEKVLFFAIIFYTVKNNNNTIDINGKEKIRVLRNLLLRVRQQNQTKFNSNLRYENLSKYIKSTIELLSINDLTTLDALDGFSDDSFSFEKQKISTIKTNSDLKDIIYELEDNILLQGSIHNIFSDPLKIRIYLNAFKEIWSIEDNSLIIRSLLTIGDYSIKTGWSHLGNRWYFGNGLNWHTILTNAANKTVRNELRSIFTNYLEKYITSSCRTPKEKLNEMIDNWLKNNIDKNWTYYFIKYSEFTETDNNIFTWKYIDENTEANFQIRSLTGNSLRAWHINPYIKTVVKIINNNNICILDDCCWSKTSEESPLKLKNCELWCMEDGWHVYIYENVSLDNNIKNNFNLSKLVDDDGFEYFLLTDTNDKDRIKVAVEFIGQL